MIKPKILTALVASLAPLGAHPRELRPGIDCSCSPKAFQFIISLDPNCDKNDIGDNSGIADATTACFIEAGTPPDPPVNEPIKDEDIKDEESMIPEALNPDFEVQNITAFIFKEIDEDGNIISQTSQNYGNSPLENGNQINLFSVSSSLDPSLPLEGQSGKVPYSIEIRVFGFNAEDQLISNIIRWTYDMSCGSDPIQTGDAIGWLTVGKLMGPWPQFCPRVPSPSPSSSMSFLSKSSKKMTKAKTYGSKSGDHRGSYY